MNKHRCTALLLALARCALSAPALAQTHTIAELGLTFETPDDWLFITGGRTLFDQMPELQDLYTLLGDSATFWGAGGNYADANPYLSWGILSYEQPEWWITSYRELSDEQVQELNQVSGEPLPAVLHGKAATFVLSEESTADGTNWVAYTVEDGQGIFISVSLSPDAPGVALHQVRSMLASCAFAAPLSIASSIPTPTPIPTSKPMPTPKLMPTPKPTPAPTYVPAERNLLAWERAFDAIWTDMLALAPFDTAWADDRVPEGHPMTGMRAYVLPHATLVLLGDASGRLRQVSIRMPWAEGAGTTAAYDEALNQFGYLTAAAMMATAGQTTMLELNANIRLIGETFAQLYPDDVFHLVDYYAWHRMDLQLGYDETEAALFVDLFF
jgi:hypothetical protein